VPFIDIGVPTLESDVQPTTLIGESSDKKKSYEKNRKFLRLWLLVFPWAYLIYKDEEESKVI
jgi:hypothetical protein